MSSALLAIAAAAVYGTGVALQYRVASRRPEHEVLRPTLLVRLVHSRMWLLGLGADVVGFALQAAALRRGALVVVQPLLTTSLVFALGVAAALDRRRIAGRDWLSVAAVLGGLAVFVAVTEPSTESTATASGTAWFGLWSATGAAVGLLAVAARRRSGRWRAGLLAVAAGLADAFMATIAKAFSARLGVGVATLARSWQPYALAVAGLATLLVVQSAYQAGHAHLTLPIITATDPVVAAVIGVSMFGEHLVLSGLRSVALVASAAVVAVGIARLGSRATIIRDDALTGPVVT